MTRGRRESVLSGDTLDSWKAIAAYLKRDVRTVLRWEQARLLPVHRVPGGGRPTVYAIRSEIDSWLANSPQFIEPPARDRAVTTRLSVAVLPFVNLSSDKENEYFIDGLADEIITGLSGVPGVRVMARTSSFVFRGRQQDVRTIGKELGVGMLVEGSVQQDGGRIRISVQLVNVHDGFHIWSQHFDRMRAGLFSIEDEISQAVVQAVQRVSAART